MKIYARENTVLFKTENDFEVLALKNWVGKDASICVEVYDTELTKTPNGYMKIQFKEPKNAEA